MCAERIQRLIQAIILGMVMGMAAMGFAGEQGMLQLAFLLQLAMMIMLIIAGLTGWCPGLMVLKKIFPPCKCEESDEG
jgi:Mg/Co/Ni transporter MgtE